MHKNEDTRTIIFPNQDDLETLLHDGSYISARHKLNESGIFLGCQRDDFHVYMSRFVFEKSFYAALCGHAKRKQGGISLSGLRTSQGELELIRKQFIECRKRPALLHEINHYPKIVQVSTIQGDSFTANLEYTIMNYNASAMYRRDNRALQILVQKLPNNDIEIYGDPQSAQDSVIIRDVATEIFKTLSYEITPLSLDPLVSAENKVEFFDSILKKKSKDWHIDEVCGLSIRIDKHDDDDDESGFDLVDKSTQILNRAVLEGKGLRDHNIVQGLLKDGYFFYTATIWVIPEKASDYKLKIRIEFKKRPSIPVITAEVARLYHTDGDTESWDKVSVPKELGQSCVRYFWDLIYDEYAKKLKSLTANAKTIQKNSNI